jgi:hypothetical protein
VLPKVLAARGLREKVGRDSIPPPELITNPSLHRKRIRYCKAARELVLPEDYNNQ